VTIAVLPVRFIGREPNAPESRNVSRTPFGGSEGAPDADDECGMDEKSLTPLRTLDPFERIALAVREALPGEAGELLLARIVDELAELDEVEGGTGQGELHLELERQVTTDPVTGLPNRVRFMDDLTRAIAAAKRHDEPLSLLVLDLADRNADEQAAGEALLRFVRITDIVARVAPGRFAIILPRTGTIGCALVAARVAALDGHPASIGAVTFAGEPTDAPALLARAEDALRLQPS
jgi:GGDEF domain-containing protein